MSRLWLVVLATASLGAAPPPRPLFDGPWPRGFFFRASEGAARSPANTYEAWSGHFSQLLGIMGKVLDEEIVGTSQTNIPYFTRFAADRPDQAVMLHYNGNARDPRVAEAFFPGHFIYFCGPALTADIDAEQTVIPVADTAPFRLDTGRYDDRNDDLMLAPMVDGRVDWAGCEHLELVAVDSEARTLTVKRGCFGTPARAHAGGRTVVQIHRHEGPWGQRNNLLWFYNWRTDGPRDAAGRSCLDLVVAEFIQRFGPGGELSGFAGVEFDVLGWQQAGSRNGYGVDTDGDNQPDWGVVDGVNHYALGVYEFCRRLREAMPEKLWMADGWSPHNQRAVGVLNGIEAEGWPTLSDADCTDWSGGLNRHRYNMQFAATPRFSYVNHKLMEDGDATVHEPHITRLVQAACIMMDNGFCFAEAPRGPRPGPALVPIFDELIGGDLANPSWLGQPLTAATQVTASGPDRLRGAGARISLPAVPAGTDLSASVATLDLDQGHYLVTATLQSDPPAGMPAGVPRKVTVSLVPPGELFPPTNLRTGMQRRGQEPTDLDPTSGAAVRYDARRVLAGTAHPAIFVHPPWQAGAPGLTWFELTATVPAAGQLEFLTGLNDTARAPTDGVTYIVTARPAAGGEAAVEVFREHRATRAWEPATADLSAFAGQTVVLRCSTDCGPADNTTADQAMWGALRLVEAGRPSWRLPAGATPGYMTWAGPEPFAASFAFRQVGPGPAEVRVDAEGAGPLAITDLRVMPGPDVWVRVFEHGLVAANAGDMPVTLDLTRFSGHRYRRLRGAPEQWPEVNNGQPVGEAIDLGPRDAIFLARVE